MTRFSPNRIVRDPMDQPESYTYLLRLQRSRPDGSWRIRLETVGAEGHTAFASLDELHHFLEARMEGTNESSGS